MSLLKAFFLSFSFLTNIPFSLFLHFDYQEKDFKRSIIFFPIIGFFIGIINISIYYLLYSFFSSSVNILIILFFQYLLFNLFHFDGFLDFFEAILSGKKNSDDIMRIMKDPRIGSIGLFIGMIYILIKVSLLKELYLYPIILFFYPIVGRISQVILMGIFPISQKANLGLLFRDIPILFTFISYILGISLFLIYPKSLLIAVVSSFLASLFVGLIAYRKIGGSTGDVIGASNELGEILFLLLSLLFYI